MESTQPTFIESDFKYGTSGFIRSWKYYIIFQYSLSAKLQNIDSSVSITADLINYSNNYLMIAKDGRVTIYEGDYDEKHIIYQSAHFDEYLLGWDIFECSIGLLAQDHNGICYQIVNGQLQRLQLPKYALDEIGDWYGFRETNTDFIIPWDSPEERIHLDDHQMEIFNSGEILASNAKYTVVNYPENNECIIYDAKTRKELWNEFHDEEENINVHESLIFCGGQIYDFDGHVLKNYENQSIITIISSRIKNEYVVFLE